MKISLDQTTDYSRGELLKFTNDINLPEYVKTAELDDANSVKDLSKEAFADQWNKAFPIYTPASTFISSLYFNSKKADLYKMWGNFYTSAVSDSLNKAAQVHGIEKDIEEATKSLIQKQAADYNDSFIYTAKLGGEDVELYKVKTAADFTDACNDFSKNVGNFPFEWRLGIAQNFVKRASEFGVDELPDLVCKYAGMFYPDIAALDKELEYRMSKLSSEDHKKIVSQLRDILPSIEKTSEFMQLAEIVYNTEKVAGLYSNHERKCILRDVVDAVFTLPIEKVAEIVDVVKMGNFQFSMRDLKKVSSDKYEEAFGVVLDPQKEAELREVLPTMPLSDVRMFQELTGIKPVA